MLAFKKRSRLWRFTLTTVVAGAAVGVGVGGYALAGGSRARGPNLPTGKELSSLSSLSYGFAAANGDAHPSSAAVYTGTREQVLRVMSTMPLAPGMRIGNSDEDVYAVQLRGNFVGYAFPTPSKYGTPTGVALTLVFNATNNQILDTMINKAGHIANLTPLGASEALPAPS